MGTIFRKIKEEKGSILIEVMIGLFLMASAMVWILGMIDDINMQNKKKTIAEHFTRVFHMTNTHLEEEYRLLAIKTAILDGKITPTSCELVYDGVDFNDFILDENILLDVFNYENILEQTYRASLRATTNGKPILILYTEGGNFQYALPSVDNPSSTKKKDKNFFYQFIPDTSRMIGIHAGFMPIPEVDLGFQQGIARGSTAQWVFDFNTAQITDPGPGHLISVKIVGERSVFVDIRDAHLLHREPDPLDPTGSIGLNSMKQILDMSKNNITNIGGLGFDTTVVDNPKTFCAIAENDGMLFYDNHEDGGSEPESFFICGNGKANIISSSANSALLQEVRLVSNGDIVLKPNCDVGLSPKVFVAPSVFSGIADLSETDASPIVGVQSWATDNRASWKINLRIKTTDNKEDHEWIYPHENYGKVMVFTMCDKSSE